MIKFFKKNLLKNVSEHVKKLQQIDEDDVNVSDVIDKLKNIISELEDEGPDIEISTLILKTALNNNRENVFDNYTNKEEIFCQTDLLRDYEKYTQNLPSYLLPVPEILEVNDCEFSTCFPLVEEGPVFSIFSD